MSAHSGIIYKYLPISFFRLLLSVV